LFRNIYNSLFAKGKMKIILASQSSPRKRALNILGLKYEVIPSNFDEKSIRDKNPYELSRKLAEAKAKEIAKKEKDAIIIAADMFVVFNGEIYEKPKDKKEAFEMLKSFSGNRLETVSGLSVYNSKTGKMLSTCKKYTIKFRKLLDSEIEDYISRYPVLKCAAAYDTDGELRFAESVEAGEFPFTTALPMNELILFLREQGVEV
jgi:septum formation protein